MPMELIAFLISLYLCNVQTILVRPQGHCVPTLTVQGPCHVCVCNAEGVFICQAAKCPKTEVNPRKSTKGECQSQVTYRFKELFCTCNHEGKWMTFNCRETFQSLRPNRTVTKRHLRSNTSITCTPNSLFLIDCNICQCENTGDVQPLSCTNRICSGKGHKSDVCKFGDFLRTGDEICLCSDINYYIDRLCVKVDDKIVQEIERNDVALITNVNQLRKNDSCIPFNEYRIDCNRCVCNKNGELVCANKICGTTVPLRSGGDSNDFYNLPQINDERNDCVPGHKYRIQCNTCVCSHKRTLSCTTMICLENFVFGKRTLVASLLPDS